MERKKISELAQVKIMNFNLSLKNLQLRANLIVAEKNKTILDEFDKLKCKPGEWMLNEKTWELEKREVPKDDKRSDDS